MTNSATSTNARRSPIAPAQGSGFHAWHFFILFSMIGATAVVIVARDTHPAALLLLSAAVICSGLVGLAVSRAVAGFFTGGAEALPLPPQAREILEREKTLVLRSIKELEFDKAMGKVSEEDYAAILAQLRTRALTLMRDLEREPAAPESQPVADSQAVRGICASCGTGNDADARFCKSCGTRLDGAR
jgi:hypothetical protein